MHIVISILSDQLIPNLLFIKQMGVVEEMHVFLTTPLMEEKHKSETLAKALGLEEGQYRTVRIDANNPTKILECLNQADFSRDSSYIVNVTGGTKMMSQMTYNFFKEFPDSQVYYWPIEFDYAEELHPGLATKRFEQNVSLDLKTYLAAYGYTYTENNKLRYNASRAEELYSMVCRQGDAGKVKLITIAQNPTYTKEDKNYLMGGWFEEWLYSLLKSELSLPDSHIGLNLKLKGQGSQRKTDSDNEIDIAFVYCNTLYIIECKVFNSQQAGGKKITDAIYKISSIRQSMGLNATALVAILAPFGESMDRDRTIKYLCKMANVRKVFSLSEMKDRPDFVNILKKIVKYE